MDNVIRFPVYSDIPNSWEQNEYDLFLLDLMENGCFIWDYPANRNEVISCK